MQYDNLDPVEVIAQQIKSNIDLNNGEGVITALLAAETYLTDRKELMFDAYRVAGEYRLSQSDHANSILYFNKTRKYNPTTVFVFDKIVESALAFYTANKHEFIKSDLLKLIPPIKMLIDYYRTLAGSEQSNLKAEDLLSRIAYRMQYVAPDSIEGKMTHRVSVIVDALEKDVPMEQVRQEVAKFIADLLKKKKLTSKSKDQNKELKI